MEEKGRTLEGIILCKCLETYFNISFNANLGPPNCLANYDSLHKYKISYPFFTEYQKSWTSQRVWMAESCVSSSSNKGGILGLNSPSFLFLIFKMSCE